MFFTFLVLLLAGAIVPVALFSSAEILGLGGLNPMSLASGQSRARQAAHGAWSFAQAYIWLGWAAYCASLGLGYALKPTSGSPWVYVSVSLFATAIPIAYLRVKDRSTSGSDDEERRLQRGSNFWKVVVLSACICFWIAPNLISRPFGWLSPVAPKVLVGFHPNIDIAVGAAPGRTTIVTSSPRTPDPWQPPVATASAPPTVGRRTDTSVPQADSPCGDTTTAGRDGDEQDGCDSGGTDGVGTND